MIERECVLLSLSFYLFCLFFVVMAMTIVLQISSDSFVFACDSFVSMGKLLDKIKEEFKGKEVNHQNTNHHTPDTLIHQRIIPQKKNKF